MRLRETHMEAFRDAANQSFAHQLAADLRRDYASDVRDLSDELLLDRVLFGIDRARSHALTTRRSIAAFVFLMFSTSPRFDAQPRVGRILDDGATGPDARMDMILATVPGAEWQKLRSLRGDRSWPMHLREDAA